jgi:transcriptional regulator with XRE-family HTH domain
MNLGKTVKALRERRDLSQSMLAKRARLAQPYLAQIERGVRKNPSLKTLRNIARALRVSVETLIK